MPELPEVEVTRRALAPLLTGQKVTQWIIREPRLRWPIPEDVQQLVGQAISRVSRRAKYLLLECVHGALLVHLGMSGSLRVLARDSKPNRHDHIDLLFANQTCLRLTDPRRFGAILWADYPLLAHPLLRDLGPEPLSDQFTAQMLYEQARHSKMAIKPFLMDAHKVVGIGNIYATEALFQARIDPRRPAKSIALKRYQRLVPIIQAVLDNAIRRGGTTLRDFTSPQGRAGYFQQSLQVYGRAGQPCVQCGRVLYQVVQSGRKSVLCTHCQR